MKDYVKALDKLPLLVKILLALPIINGIIYGIYRICKGHLIAGILWFFLGGTILWIIDMVTIITSGKPILFAD